MSGIIKALDHMDKAKAAMLLAYADGLDHSKKVNAEMLAVLKELQESAAYWSEYDVPLGIVDRINQAIEKAEGTK